MKWLITIELQGYTTGNVLYINNMTLIIDEHPYIWMKNQEWKQYKIPAGGPYNNCNLLFAIEEPNG